MFSKRHEFNRFGGPRERNGLKRNRKRSGLHSPSYQEKGNVRSRM